MENNQLEAEKIENVESNVESKVESKVESIVESKIEKLTPTEEIYSVY